MILNRFIVSILSTLSLSVVSQTGLAQEAAPPKLPSPVIDETAPTDYKFVSVKNSKIAYIDRGEGDVVVFLHGNPTSSYLWRNILPYLEDSHRVIALDLIGMGQSGKPDIDYSFSDHNAYLTAFIEKLGLEDITFVGHDWGATLAWYYAANNPDRVKQVAFMEGVLPPLFPIETYDVLGEVGTPLKSFRETQAGANQVLDNNVFVEGMLPNLILRPLGETAMSVYREPFPNRKTRKPTLAWPRELPVDGKPAHTVKAMEEIAAFMGETEIPTLMIYVDPGVATPATAIDWYVDTITNIETRYVGQGLHFFQEDHPVAIGTALEDWLRRMR